MAKGNGKATLEIAEIRSPKLKEMELTIVGESPLVVHRWSKKAVGEMFAKQIKVTWPKTPKDPAYEYDAATYWIDAEGNEIGDWPDLSLIATGQVEEYIRQDHAAIDKLRKLTKPRFGFPAKGLKACAVRGAKVLGLTMTDMRGGFFVPQEYVEISGERSMRVDMVRVGMTTDIRFRPEWPEWSMTLPVLFNSSAMKPDIVANLFNAGGFSCGLGECRPEKGGSWGRFSVVGSPKK